MKISIVLYFTNRYVSYAHGLITVVLAHLETRIDQKDYVREGEGLRLSRFVTQGKRYLWGDS